VLGSAFTMLHNARLFLWRPARTSPAVNTHRASRRPQEVDRYWLSLACVCIGISCSCYHVAASGIAS
jgi:hypothetical protein